MAGVIKPDTGVATIGASVALGYYAQHQMELLDRARTVLGELEAHAPTTGYRDPKKPRRRL